MPCRLEVIVMGKGKGSGRNEFWRTRGTDKMVGVVRKRTAASLKEKGISAKRGSKPYQEEFNRLAHEYFKERREKFAERKRRDEAWLAEHRNDSDEELLAYVHSAVQDRIQLTKPSRVAGGQYIAQHFGGWRVAVHLAGLEMPKGYKPAAPEAVEAYLKKQAEQVQSVNQE